MVHGQGQTDGVDELDIAVRLADRPDLDGVDAEDGHLGRVDQRGERFDPEAPQVGDRERPATQVVGGDHPLHGLGGQFLDPARQVAKGEVLTVPDHRYHQPARRVAGEGHVDLRMPVDGVVDELGIQVGNLEQGLDGGEDHQVTDADLGGVRGGLEAPPEREQGTGIGRSVQRVLGRGTERLA